MSISWRFVGKRCPRLSSLSLSALLCGFLTVSVPASAPVYCSQLSRSCHSSAQNSPVASISLQGKAKALYGPSPSPSSRCSDVPDTISSYFQPPTHAHTHTCTHTHACARAHTHTAQAAWNSPLLLEPAGHLAVTAFTLHLLFSVMSIPDTCMAHTSPSSGLFFQCCLLSDALSEYPLPQQSQFLILTSFYLEQLLAFNITYNLFI